MSNCSNCKNVKCKYDKEPCKSCTNSFVPSDDAKTNNFEEKEGLNKTTDAPQSVDCTTCARKGKGWFTCHYCELEGYKLFKPKDVDNYDS